MRRSLVSASTPSPPLFVLRNEMLGAVASGGVDRFSAVGENPLQAREPRRKLYVFDE